MTDQRKITEALTIIMHRYFDMKQDLAKYIFTNTLKCYNKMAKRQY